MDLQTQRCLEGFLRLSDLGPCRIERRMEFILPPFRLYIEYMQGRMLLSLAHPVEACQRITTLRALLRRCHPASTQGMVLRAYLVGEQQMLSATLAPGSDVNQWLACLRALRQRLERLPWDSQ